MLRSVLTEYVSAALPEMTPMEKSLLTRDLSRLVESWAKAPRSERRGHLEQAVQKLGTQSVAATKSVKLELVVSRKRLNEEQIHERSTAYIGKLAKRLAVVDPTTNKPIEEPTFELTAVRSDERVSVYRASMKGRGITEKRIRSAADHLSKKVKLPLERTLFDLTGTDA